MEKTFIGGYWSERAESIHGSAHKIKRFLRELEAFGELFSNLKLPAYSKKQAMKNKFEIDKIDIVSHLKDGVKTNELNDQGLCKIGFNFSVFDEIQEDLSVEVSFGIGAYSKYNKNVCYVHISGIKIDDQLRNKILELIKRVFEPETIRNE